MQSRSSRSRAPRVLWVHQYFVGSKSAGSERAQITLDGLLARGWQVKLVSASDGYQEDRPTAEGSILTEGNLEWHRLSLSSTGPRARARSYWEFFWRALMASWSGSRPDLVFTSSPPPTQMLLALLLALRWRVRLVLEIRDLWPFFLEGMGLVRSKLGLAALRRLEWLGYRSAAAVVSASPAFRPYLEACGILPAALIDAPHGARRRDLGALSTAGRAFRAAHGLRERPIILFAGSLQDHYAVDTWLAAAAALAKKRPHAVLVVAGGGRARHRVEAAARSSSNILYLGTVPRAQLDAAVGAADVGLVCLSPVPGFEFVLPGKLVDLLSCAVPVVTTVPGQTTKLVQLADAGWLAKDNPADLLAAMKLAIDAGPLERRRRGSLGRTFVLRHLSSDAQANAIANICEAVIEGRAPKPHHSGQPRSRALRATALLRAGGSDLAAASFQSWLKQCCVIEA